MLPSLFQYYNNALIIYNDARVQDALLYLKENMERWKENAVMNDAERRLEEIYIGKCCFCIVKPVSKFFF